MNIGNESETLEYKKSTGELKQAAISIASILNKHSVGTLYFGVKPNGDIVGQQVSESTLRDVSRVIYESIKPQIYPVIEEITIEDCHLIKVEFNGSECPYSAYGKYYLRTADEDREVTPAELRRIFVANEYKENWERSQTDFMEDRVDEKTIKRFYDTAVQAGRLAADNYDKSLLLNRLGLVNEGFLNHAGNALFGETKPITLKAGIFATSEKLTILDIKMFEDNIFNLLSFSETYILKNINWRAEIIGSTRREIPEIPVEVIREILANSFAHSVYNSSTYHEICIHPDKVTVYSPGIFASPYKPEDYIDKNLQSSIRNPKIAKVLYMNKSIEQFGSGFKRIDSLCKDSNLNYSYESTELGFTFIVYRPNVMTHERIDESIITDDELLNDVEEAVYNLLKKDNKLTRDDLAHATSKTVRTIQRALDSLKKKKLIKRVGSNKSGYWNIL